MNTECNDCEYRACRDEDGCLGECREPYLREEMSKLNKWLALSICSTIAIFVVAMVII